MEYTQSQLAEKSKQDFIDYSSDFPQGECSRVYLETPGYCRGYSVSYSSRD